MVMNALQATTIQNDPDNVVADALLQTRVRKRKRASGGVRSATETCHAHLRVGYIM